MSIKNKEQEAWGYSKLWMKEKTYSKALKCEVKITRKGWDHINRGTKYRRRKSKDRISRFNLLKLAKYIIKNVDEYEVNFTAGEKYFVLKYQQSKREIKVLLKEDPEKKKYFYSVMKS